MKSDQERVWCRSAESKPGKEIWEQDEFPQTTLEIWPVIEAEALSMESLPNENRTTLTAIVFREDEAGNYYTEPLKISQCDQESRSELSFSSDSAVDGGEFDSRPLQKS